MLIEIETSTSIQNRRSRTTSPRLSAHPAPFSASRGSTRAATSRPIIRNAMPFQSDDNPHQNPEAPTATAAPATPPNAIHASADRPDEENLSGSLAGGFSRPSPASDWRRAPPINVSQTATQTNPSIPTVKKAVRQP